MQMRFNDPTQEETLQQLIAARARYAEAFIAMADEVEGDDLRTARKVYADQVRPALQSLLSHSNQLLERENQHIERQLRQAQGQFDSLFVWLVVLAMVDWMANTIAHSSPCHHVPVTVLNGQIGQ